MKKKLLEEKAMAIVEADVSSKHEKTVPDSLEDSSQLAPEVVCNLLC